MKKVIPLVVSLQKQLRPPALGTRFTHKEQILTIKIIVISGNIIHQQEGYYFKEILLHFSLLNFAADSLIISIEIVDFIHTVQMQVTWVPGNLRS